MRKAKNYTKIYEDFQRDILSGAFPAGELFIAAVERHKNDLTREGTKGFPYHFDVAEGAKVCRFIEKLSHIKGPKSGERIDLEPFQVWIFMCAYGWRNGKERRYRRLSIWMNRGNGKSLLASGLARFAMVEGQGAEVSTAAVTAHQARQVFDTAKHMLSLNPTLRDKIGFQPREHKILIPKTFSEMKPISHDSGSNEGAISSFCCLDEVHAWGSRNLYDTLMTGLSKRPNSLCCIISTAPEDLSSIGYEIWSTTRKLLLGEYKDETEFGVIIAADETDDVWSPATWRKANPGMGISIDEVQFTATANRAKQIPSQRGAFFNRHLGLVVSQGQPYINRADWAACTDRTLKREQFMGKRCWVGVDLASMVDLACVAYVFSEEGKFYCFVDSYLNKRAVEDSRNAAYPGWAETGQVIVTALAETDFETIKQDIIKASNFFNIQEIAADPWQATSFLQDLDRHGLVTSICRPVYANLSQPTKHLEALALNRQIVHDGNEVLSWAISNVVLRRDGKDNVLPDKQRPQDKIDPVMALVTALSRAKASEPKREAFQVYVLDL